MAGNPWPIDTILAMGRTNSAPAYTSLPPVIPATPCHSRHTPSFPPHPVIPATPRHSRGSGNPSAGTPDSRFHGRDGFAKVSVFTGVTVLQRTPFSGRDGFAEDSRFHGSDGIAKVPRSLSPWKRGAGIHRQARRTPVFTGETVLQRSREACPRGNGERESIGGYAGLPFSRE